MEGYLRQCLSSLVIENDELFNKTEVLIINDGSKDASLQIAKEYESQYPQVFRPINKENGNYGSCVNRGLKEANGKYIKILDADDTFYIDSYANYVKSLLSTDADLVITNYNRVNSNGGILVSTKFSLPTHYKFGLNSLDPSRGIEMHAITYRTDMLREHSYIQTEGISYTDAEWSCIPLKYVNNVVYLPICLYRYLVDREGQTVDPKVRVKSLWMMEKVFKVILTDYLQERTNMGHADKIVFMKLISLSSYIYRVSLLSKDNTILASLLEFDSYIREKDPALYHKLNKVKLDKYLPIYYILNWRINPDGHYPYWMAYTTLQWLRNRFHRMKAIIRT